MYKVPNPGLAIQDSIRKGDWAIKSWDVGDGCSNRTEKTGKAKDKCESLLNRQPDKDLSIWKDKQTIIL